MKKFLYVIILSFSVFILSIVNVSAQQTVEIMWDNYGVPHIDAQNEADMYYAFGWSQMHNHGNLLLQLYGQARGRAAEYWGEKYLESDMRMQLFNLYDSVKAQYSRQEPESRTYLDAFVKGVNAYAQQHPDALSEDAKKVLPVTTYDVLAHTKRVIYLEFLAGDDIFTAMRTVGKGSNSYAIAPTKSASKHAMLVANPHLPWGDFFIFFEAHLAAPGFNAYGASLVGIPVLNIAFNDNLGWTHTVNTIDASDRYELTLKDSGYVLDGEVQPFQKKQVSIKVSQPNAGFIQHDTTFAYSAHGAVVGKRNGKAYAVRIAGMENADFLSEYHKMAKARDWKAFESAIQMLQNPMFNIVYADKAGNILYLFNGDVPKRPSGDWNFWHNDIDGTQSKYIWHQYHTYAELPKLFNPSTGFVQNANDAPWTCTYPTLLDAKKFPAYMSPQTMPLRPQRAVNMIKKNPAISFDALVKYKLNTGMEAADRFLADLLKAVQQSGDTTAKRAALVLKAWDKQTNADSRGAILFAHWFDLLGDNIFLHPWNAQQPVTTPRGLKDPKKAVEVLSKAVAEVEKKYGNIAVAWGEVCRFKVGKYDFPANGGPGEYGIFRTIYFSNAEDNKAYAFHGDSYVAITEFGSNVKAQVLLSYGNASQPGNKHVGDQLSLLSKKQMRTALLQKEDILKHVEEKEVLKINP